MASNIVFTAEKTEISEQESFSIRRTGWDTWDASLPWATLSDCTMTITAAFAAQPGSITRGINYQVENVVGSYRPKSRLQWLNTSGQEYILSIYTDELPLLASALADLAAEQGQPLDLDASELTPIKPGNRFDNQLADAVKNPRTELSQAIDASVTEGTAGLAGDVADLETLTEEGRLSEESLGGTFVPQSYEPVNLLKYATTFPSDQTAAVQAAVDAVPVGGALTVPAGTQFRVDGQVNISKAITVLSPGMGGFYSQVSGTTAQRMFRSTSGNVHFQGVKLKGSQYAVAANQYGISFIGASPAVPAVNVSVVDCDISEFAYAGIFAQYVRQIKFDRNRVHDIAYAGIMTASCTRGTIDDNDVWNITQATGYVNSYGITASRTPGSLVDQPRSAGLSIKSNRVSDVPLWVGIDTHGGQGLLISENIITNCGTSISLVSAQDAGLAYVFAPLDMEITNNLIDSGVTDGSRGAGVNLSGNVTQRATGKIVGNTVRGCGQQAVGSGAGIYLENTDGAIVGANRVIEPGVSGITAYANNVGFTISGNTIVDQWSNSVNTKSVNVQIDGNTGYVGENTALVAGKAATYTAANGFGVFIANQPTNIISLGTNRMGVTVTPLYDPGAKARIGFFGVASVAKPSAYTQTYATANKTHAAYTPNDKSAAFTAVPAALTDAATLADLNALRIAVENLRLHHQSTAQVVNAVIDDLQAEGLVG